MNNSLFDTGNIQHLEYPRDLRYTEIESFKFNLKKKLISTLEFALSNTDKSMYLEQYGNLTPSKIDEKEVDVTEYFERALGSIRKDFKRLEGRILNENLDFNSNAIKNSIYLDNDLSKIINAIVRAYFDGTAITSSDVFYSDDLFNEVIQALDVENIKCSPKVLTSIIKQAVKDVSRDYMPF